MSGPTRTPPPRCWACDPRLPGLKPTDRPTPSLSATALRQNGTTTSLRNNLTLNLHCSQRPSCHYRGGKPPLQPCPRTHPDGVGHHVNSAQQRGPVEPLCTFRRTLTSRQPLLHPQVFKSKAPENIAPCFPSTLLNSKPRVQTSFPHTPESLQRLSLRQRYPV